MGPDLSLVFKALLTISLTGINEIKHLSWILSQTRFLMLSCFHETSSFSKEKLFLRQEINGLGELGHFTLARQASPILSWKSNYALCGLFATPCYLASNCLFSLSFISEECTSLQAPCRIFVDEFVRLKQPISRCLGSVVSTHFIYLRCPVSPLPLMHFPFSAASCILVISTV
jgi:hypothetical protein